MNGSLISADVVSRILDDASSLRYHIRYLEVWMGEVDIRRVEQALDKLSQLSDFKYD